MHQAAAARSYTLQPPLIGEWTTRDASWFAVYTISRHEKCIARHFGERNLESFLPLYQKEYHWKKRCSAQTELPLFPNYVFVHIRPEQRIPVLNVPGVLGIVGGRIPSPLPDAEMEALRAAYASGHFEPYPYLAEGERVRIKAGAMAGMEGILLRRKSSLRVVLTIDLIQRSVAAEMNAEDVEPVLQHRV